MRTRDPIQILQSRAWVIEGDSEKIEGASDY